MADVSVIWDRVLQTNEVLYSPWCLIDDGCAIEVTIAQSDGVEVVTEGTLDAEGRTSFYSVDPVAADKDDDCQPLPRIVVEGHQIVRTRAPFVRLKATQLGGAPAVLKLVMRELAYTPAAVTEIE